MNRTLFRSLSAALVALAFSGCNAKVKHRHASSSMEPAIKAGEIVEIDERAFSSKPPDRWDVIAFTSPKGSTDRWVSRVVGLPGETIEIKAGQLVINGRPESTPSHVKIPGYREPEDVGPVGPGPVKFPYAVPSGHFFVLGDNVGNSLDSRYWGSLEGSKIVGKVLHK